jgi:hypothetical protein
VHWDFAHAIARLGQRQFIMEIIEVAQSFKHLGNKGKPIELRFEGIFSKEEAFGGVYGASVHKYPHFLLLGGK